MQQVYIGEIKISPAMAQKIMTKHGVTPEEVREACQAPNSYRRAAWHIHPEHGRRLIVFGLTPRQQASEGDPATSRFQGRNLATADCA
jgi:hypothetical protein